MRAISLASGAFVLAVSLVASSMACVGGDDKTVDDPSALSNEPASPDEGSSDPNLGAIGGLHACGDVNTALLASASCKVVIDSDPSVMCDSIHLGFCGYAACAAECDASAALSCKAACGVDCAADCKTKLDLEATVACEAYCGIDAVAACAASFQKLNYDSQAACEVAATAACAAECHVCAKVEATADCAVKCDASCDASCHAKANLDCQLGCQADLYTALEASCTAELKAEGALFCDDSYIFGVVDAHACLQALLSVKD